MNKTTLSLHEFVASPEAMQSVAGLVINPTIYRDKNISEIVEDFNKVMDGAGVPFEIAPTWGVVYYLRFEEERLDRALYILSCLVHYDNGNNTIN